MVFARDVGVLVGSGAGRGPADALAVVEGGVEPAGSGRSHPAGDGRAVTSWGSRLPVSGRFRIRYAALEAASGPCFGDRQHEMHAFRSSQQPLAAQLRPGHETRQGMLL